MLSGFGAVALALLAYPAYVAYTMHRMEAASPRPTNVDNPIAKAFLGTSLGEEAPNATVSLIDAILLIGTSRTVALDQLGASGFVCYERLEGAACTRKVENGLSQQDWTVNLSFDDAAKVSRRSAHLRENGVFP